MRIVWLLILLTPLVSQADQYSDEFKRQDLRKMELYRGNSSNLKEEMRDEVTGQTSQDEEPRLAKEPTVEEPAQPMPGPQENQYKPGMTLQEASKIGRELLDKNPPSSQRK